MNEATLNLWRQIEGFRRKRLTVAPPRQPAKHSERKGTKGI
jgi:hypothetical protein